MLEFEKFGLEPKIIANLKKGGYSSPTPIQAQAIPYLLKKKDLLGIAQTGTGKTAAFSLPIIDGLFKNSTNKVRANNVRALILTPTRELATQIVTNVRHYSQGLYLKSEAIFGGVSINNQIRDFKKGFDVVVATPGRLLDLMSQGHVRFSQLEVLVLDEADRMLDMGFIRDIRKIIAKLPAKRQSLLFSATMPKDIASLAHSLLNDPIKVEVSPESTTVEKIDQRVHFVEKSNKTHLLKSILGDESAKSVLVFTKTKHGANRVVKFLDKEGIRSCAIHGNKSQVARQKALDEFRTGNVGVLIATDIAARGIDVKNITHVINFDLPNEPESYVHRIGRTARAGKEGVAIAFCEPAENKLLRAIEKSISYKIPIDKDHPFHGVPGLPQQPNENSGSRSRSGSRPAGRSGARSGNSYGDVGTKPKKKRYGSGFGLKPTGESDSRAGSNVKSGSSTGFNKNKNTKSFFSKGNNKNK